MGDKVRRPTMMELAPDGGFPGISGDAWEDAARSVSEELGVPVETVVIGSSRDVADLCCDWVRRLEATAAALRSALTVVPGRPTGAVA